MVEDKRVSVGWVKSFIEDNVEYWTRYTGLSYREKQNYIAALEILKDNFEMRMGESRYQRGVSG